MLAGLKRAAAYFKNNKPFTITLLLLIAAVIFLGTEVYQDVQGQVKEQLSVYDNAVKVEFQDKNFEAEVRKVLKKEGGALYDTDLETIGKLVIQNVNIKRVDELKYFTGLRYLEISSAKIVDLSPLTSLDDLTTLILSNNRIEDLSPLSGCEALQKLDVSGNSIMDISPLYGLDKLIELNVSNNSIGEVSEEIRKLENLKILNLSRNRISDNSAFSGMSGLNILYLTTNKISQVQPLSGMDSLTEYSLEGNSIQKIDTLGRLPSLEKLSVGANCLTDIDFAPQYPWLLEFTISQNDIVSLEPLRDNTDLQVLKMQSTKVEDLTPLENLKDFNSIYLDNDFDRGKIRFMKKENGWQFRNGDTLTKQYILDDKYGFSGEDAQ